MRKLSSWFVGGLLISNLGFAAPDQLIENSSLCSSKYQKATFCRRMSAEILRFTWSEDLVKPLAATEFGGWVLAADVLVGSLNKQWVTGVSFKDRKHLWWYKTDVLVSSPIAVFSNWVVLGLQDGRIIKIDARSGEKVWESSVAHAASRRFVLSGNDLFIFTINNQLFSLNFQTGKSNWVYESNQAAQRLTLRHAASPVVANGKVYLGISDGEVHAVDQSSGQLLWRVNPAYSDVRFQDVVADMMIQGTKLIVARYDGILASLELEGSPSDRVVWKNQYPSLTVAKLHDGIVYAGGLNGTVFALEALSGKQLWSMQTGQSVDSLTVGDKVLYAAGTKGRISALALRNSGEVLWSDDVESSFAFDPIVFEGKIYFISPMKLLYGYKLQ
jgi:outer membrane protein assembly factor BamB